MVSDIEAAQIKIDILNKSIIKLSDWLEMIYRTNIESEPEDSFIQNMKNQLQNDLDELQEYKNKFPELFI